MTMPDPTSLTLAVDEQMARSSRLSEGLVTTTTTPTAPVRAEPIGLDQEATSVQALVVIAVSCLRQIALNRAGVREGSSEAVHQMRVGLRRLRPALSIFQKLFRAGEADD